MGRIVRKKCGFGFSQTPNGLRVPRPNSFRNLKVVRVKIEGVAKAVHGWRYHSGGDFPISAEETTSEL